MDTRGPDAAEVRDVAERSRGALQGVREAMASAAAARGEHTTRIAEEATRLVEQLASHIASELSEDLQQQQADWQTAAQQQLDEERAAFDGEKAQWQAEREQWESVRNQVEAELAAQEARLTEDAQRVATEQSAQREAEWNALLDAAEAARATAQVTADALSTQLENAQAELAAAAELREEHDTLREKFELVLADLHTHRERVASLEEELATRPAETEPPPSDEAEALRGERDELLREVERLRDGAPGGEQTEEINDLRSRFEMAVEDVRTLKNENDSLREQLAGAANSPASGENDWEAQKRRLLAELESESDDDPAREEERASIEGTIQLTDQIVAEKDREIQRLRSSLTQEPTDPDNEAVLADAAAAALLDEDEVVQAERERLAKLEAEWQEKLRAAELELSVERAKIARAQSELAEQQLELETLRAATGGEGVTAGEAKRKWLDKLGLGADNG